MDTSVLALYLVTQCENTALDDYLSFLKLAVQGGVTLVQLRDKKSPLPELRIKALAFKALLDRFSIPLIINDHVELAAEIEAGGVHIGQSDLSPQQAREILGPNKIIGYSLESDEDLEKANQLDCLDYVAASAVFPSKNKKDCRTIWGLHGLKKLTHLSKHPVVAIGNINTHNLRDVMRQGANGVAVIGAIHDHENPLLAAKTLIEIIREAKSHV